MFLTDTYPGQRIVETAADRLVPAFTRPMPTELAKRFLSNRVCAGCSQRIAESVEHVVRNGFVFHPSCGRKYTERAAVSPTGDTRKGGSIGTISGRAAPLGRWTLIRHRDGFDFHEQFALGAFDRHLDRGDVALQVDHNGVAIPGELRLVHGGHALDFTFDVHDTPLGREVLRWMRAGECRGCSVRYDHADIRFDPFMRGEVIVSARLIEISLMRARRPAWWGTHASVSE
jgi:HK97 family phage prohead protease